MLVVEVPFAFFSVNVTDTLAIGVAPATVAVIVTAERGLYEVLSVVTVTLVGATVSDADPDE